MTKRALRVAMIGSAFMGGPTRRRGAPRRTSSTCRSSPSWRLVGRDAGRPIEPRTLGWRAGRRTGATLVERPRHRPDRHLHARRHARRDRDRGTRGRQARALREAARELRRRGRAHDGCRGAGSGARRGRDVRVQLPPHARARARATIRRRGPPRGDPARARAVPPGLAARRELADDLAPRQVEGGFGRPRRHRGAQHRHRAVAHRTDPSPRCRPCCARSSPSGPSAPRRSASAAAATSTRRRGPSRSTTRWPSPRPSPVERSASSRRRAWPPGAATRTASR